MKYEIILNDFNQEIVKRIEPNGTEWFIPTDPANSDYHAYLRWLENPNADDQPTTLNGVVTNGDN